MFDPEDWLQWRNPAVRDLVWVMLSPSLLHHEPCDGHACEQRVNHAWCQYLVQQNIDWLKRLDNEPRPLLSWLNLHQSQYLGRYFENLLSFWLQHATETDLLAQNLVVSDGALQVGEFDFIFQDHVYSGLRHWEVAVKFYLHAPEHPRAWLGPNPNDSLNAKLDKVFNQQLLLAQHPAAEQPLIECCGSTDLVPAALMKGYLFYPFDATWQAQQVATTYISDQHMRGWWCRAAALPELLAQSDDAWRWMILPKLRWLSPVVYRFESDVLDKQSLAAQVQQYFQSNRHALMVVSLAHIDDVWLEVSRGFVVDDQWPN